MKKIPSTNMDVMEFRGGGGFRILFGLPFLAAGIFAMVSLTRSGEPWYFAVPFGAIFASVGGAFVFGRSGMTVDRHRNSIDRWWGFLSFALKRTRTDLGDDGEITITREIRRNKNRSYNVYPVRIAAGADFITVDVPRNADAARTAAEGLAEFLGRPIRDSSTGEERVRAADEINLSLREQVRRKGLQTGMTQAPPGLQSRVTTQGQEVVFQLPKAGFNLVMFIPLLVFLCFAGSFAAKVLPVFLRARGGGPVVVGIVVIFSVILIILVWRILWTAHTQFTVSATPGRLTLARKFVALKKWSIPADELEELFVSGGLITAKSDNRTLTFGQNLSSEEADFVCAALQKILTV